MDNDRQRRCSAPSAWGSNTPTGEGQFYDAGVGPSFYSGPEARAVFKPIEQGEMKRCRVVRKAAGFSKLFPSYEMYYQDAQLNQTFAMSARKKRHGGSGSLYYISLGKADADDEGTKIVAKLQSNFFGTVFTLYDYGQDPKSKEYELRKQRRSSNAEALQRFRSLSINNPRKNCSSASCHQMSNELPPNERFPNSSERSRASSQSKMHKVYPYGSQENNAPLQSTSPCVAKFSANAIYPADGSGTGINDTPLRRELAVVKYEANFMGFRGPRKMTFIIPALTKEGKRIEVQPYSERQTLLMQSKEEVKRRNLLVLHNKSPQWNEGKVLIVIKRYGRIPWLQSVCRASLASSRRGSKIFFLVAIF